MTILLSVLLVSPMVLMEMSVLAILMIGVNGCLASSCMGKETLLVSCIVLGTLVSGMIMRANSRRLVLCCGLGKVVECSKENVISMKILFFLVGRWAI